jgi:alpha-ketoglutarate-dependent taurine dioxygenase
MDNFDPTDTLFSTQTFPLVVQPNVSKSDPVRWAEENRGPIEAQLLRHGAILFRHFNLKTAEHFEQFATAIAEELMEYRERSSPRHEVGRRVYTSTDYRADLSIFPHNEHSYAMKFPLKLFFFCETPAKEGGETPIADCRKIHQRISPEIKKRFLERKYVYVRNFTSGFGVPWETSFQTTDRSAVEIYCRENNIEFEWKGDNHLRTRQCRPAIAVHPRTHEKVWFNHATFFNVSTLDKSIREPILSFFAEEDLPNNTYYSDGANIEPWVLDHLRDAYLQETVAFKWEQGDVLLLDNMLVAHSRNKYSGLRNVLVAMADPYVRSDI